MALLFVDGFDWWDNSFINSLIGAKYSLASIPGTAQGQTLGGRFGGQSFFIFNTGFDHADFYVPVANTQVSCGLAIKLNNGAKSVFYAIKNNTVGIVALALDGSNNLLVYSGGTATNGSPGTLLKTITAPFSNSVFNYLELFIIVNGVNSTLEIWLDDNPLLQMGPSAPDGVVNLGSLAPDRAGFRWESLGSSGIIVDDLYVADGSGGHNNARLGPCRVMTLPPSSDRVLAGWTPNIIGPDFQMLYEFPGGNFHAGIPDQDTTYLSGSAGASDLYGFAAFSCVGLVLGVAVNAVAKGASPVALALECSPDPGNVPVQTVASVAPPASGAVYAALQAITETDLFSGAVNWTDGDVAHAEWGIGLTSGTNVHVTQFTLEKLVTLRNVPFSCGGSQASYSF